MDFIALIIICILTVKFYSITNNANKGIHKVFLVLLVILCISQLGKVF